MASVLTLQFCNIILNLKNIHIQNVPYISIIGYNEQLFNISYSVV